MASFIPVPGKQYILNTSVNKQLYKSSCDVDEKWLFPTQEIHRFIEYLIGKGPKHPTSQGKAMV